MQMEFKRWVYFFPEVDDTANSAFEDMPSPNKAWICIKDLKPWQLVSQYIDNALESVIYDKKDDKANTAHTELKGGKKTRTGKEEGK